MVIKMKNPWTKKNPFMSMWLSGANSAMGSARGHGTAAAKREIKNARYDETVEVRGSDVDIPSADSRRLSEGLVPAQPRSVSKTGLGGRETQPGPASQQLLPR